LSIAVLYLLHSKAHYTQSMLYSISEMKRWIKKCSLFTK